MRQIDSAHGDYWFQADCELCGWYTTGYESNVDDWSWEHVTDNHPRRLAR
jgi:hypothetical protein